MQFFAPAASLSRDYDLKMGHTPKKERDSSPLKGDSFGERLSDAITRSGMTRAEFAAEVGASVRSVKYWIANKSDPTRGNLVSMVRVLGVSLDDLAGTLSGREPTYAAWAAFLATPEGDSATEEELRSLRAFPWPSGRIPSVHSYRNLLSGLRATLPKDPEPSDPSETWEGRKRVGTPTPVSGLHRRTMKG